MPAPITRQAEHHVANVAGENLAPEGHDRILWTGGHVHTAADTGVTVQLDKAFHLRATLRDAYEIRASFLPAVAAVNPRHQNCAVCGHGQTFKGVRHGAVLVDTQGRLEMLSAVE
jgi:hypothetical protein